MNRSRSQSVGKRFQKRRRLPPWAVVLLAIISLVAYRLSPQYSPRNESSSPNPTTDRDVVGEPLEAGIYRVRRVVDGDTLLLENRARVRLLGVDTPETVREDHPVEPWGPEATAFTKEFVVGGSVRLEFDRERMDRYGRYLAYVYVDDDLLNEALIRAGLSPAELHYSFSDSMKNRFRRAQQDARDARRGIWSTR